MSTEIKTPRTDVNICLANIGMDKVVSPFFARQLERELIAAQQENERLRAALLKYEEQLATCQRDKERLDWLDGQDNTFVSIVSDQPVKVEIMYYINSGKPNNKGVTIRQAIDAAIASEGENG